MVKIKFCRLNPVIVKFLKMNVQWKSNWSGTCARKPECLVSQTSQCSFQQL